MTSTLVSSGLTEGAESYHGRQILFLYSSPHDRYLTHRTSVKNYAAAYQKWGIQTSFLDISDSNVAVDFSKILGDADLLAVHCEQGWVLDGGQDIFVAFGKLAISHIRDYPFYPWLTRKALHPRPNQFLHCTEASASDFSSRYGVAAER